MSDKGRSTTPCEYDAEPHAHLGGACYYPAAEPGRVQSRSTWCRWFGHKIVEDRDRLATLAYCGRCGAVL